MAQADRSQNNYLSKREVYLTLQEIKGKLDNCLKITTSQRERFMFLNQFNSPLTLSQNNYLSKREVYTKSNAQLFLVLRLKITTSQRERFIRIFFLLLNQMVQSLKITTSQRERFIGRGTNGIA